MHAWSYVVLKLTCPPFQYFLICTSLILFNLQVNKNIKSLIVGLCNILFAFFACYEPLFGLWFQTLCACVWERWAWEWGICQFNQLSKERTRRAGVQNSLSFLCAFLYVESCELKFLPNQQIFAASSLFSSQGVLAFQELVSHNTTVTSLWNQIPQADWAHISKNVSYWILHDTKWRCILKW